MGEGTGGGVDTDVGGAGLDTGGDRDTSPSYGQSPGAMGGRVPDVQPTVMKSFDPGVYSQPVSPSVMAGNPAIPSLANNDAYQANLDFVSGIQSLTGGGMSPGAMGGRREDESPSYSPQPDPSTSMPLSVMTRPTGSVFREDNDPLGDALRDQRGRLAVTFGPAALYSPSDASGNLGTGPAFAALEKGSQRDAFRMLPINEPMGAGMETRSDLFPSQLGGGELTVTPQGFQNIISPQQEFPAELGDNLVGPLRTVPAGGGDPLLFQDSRIMGMSPGAMGGSAIGPIQGPLPTDIDPTSDAAMFANLTSRPSGALTQVALPAGRPSDAVTLAAAAKNPTSQRDFSFREFLGNIFKNLGSKAKSVGAFISGLSAEKLQDYAEQFLAGGANQKASTVGMDPFAQQGMGPGPFVGGGAPSPSGGGGGGMAAPAKDPCPPGFRFDPTLQQCVPIIAPNTPTDTTTTPTTPTTPAPGVTPPVAGGIANAYPFVLTPPIGTPVGNLPPVRLTT